MRAGKIWTKEEYDALREVWGTKSVKSIAKSFGRSENAIMVKAHRLSLGPILLASDKITMTRLIWSIYGEGYSVTYMMMKWRRDKIPTTHMKRRNATIEVIKIDDFWKWAQEHKSIMSFANFEENLLGVEPEWVKEKRAIDRCCRQRTRAWSAQEDRRLEDMLKETKYDYLELSIMLGRTESAIKRRIYDLGIRNWPLRKPLRQWSEEESQILTDMVRKGYSFEMIGKRLNRSAAGCRSKYGHIVRQEGEANAVHE